MRVLHLVNDLLETSGGPTRSVQLTASYLEVVGIENEIWHQGSAGRMLDLGREVGCENLPNVLKKSVSITNIFQLGNKLSAFDIVHIHGLWTPFIHAAAMMCRSRSVPYVVAPRGMLEPWALQQKKLKKKIAWVVYQKHDLQRASSIHCTSPLEADNVRRLLPCIKVEMIPNGTLLPDLSKRVPYRDRRALRLLFLSRIHPKKGVDLLIDVWSKLRPKGWECVICGPGDVWYIDSLKKRIARSGLTSEIQIIEAVSGKQKDLLFRSADLFVLPSHSENFGIVVAEALAYELPVVTTNQTPWSELELFNCGWFVEDSLHGIAEGLCNAMALSESERAVMGTNGRSLVASKYTWDAVADRTRQMYLRCIES